MKILKKERLSSEKGLRMYSEGGAIQTITNGCYMKWVDFLEITVTQSG